MAKKTRKIIAISVSVILALILLFFGFLFYWHELCYTGIALASYSEVPLIDTDIDKAASVLKTNGISSELSPGRQDLLVMGIQVDKAREILKDYEFESGCVPEKTIVMKEYKGIFN